MDHGAPDRVEVHEEDGEEPGNSVETELEGTAGDFSHERGAESVASERSSVTNSPSGRRLNGFAKVASTAPLHEAGALEAVCHADRG
jgi:hypothetical protein